jgi:2,4-dienoyl-CoA reductase-like NADH-dependent reductase (Old Yellow Enzyme family)
MAADDGACTPRLIDKMAALAQGGVGLIITSHAYVSPEGQAGPWKILCRPGCCWRKTASMPSS